MFVKVLYCLIAVAVNMVYYIFNGTIAYMLPDQSHTKQDRVAHMSKYTI